MKQNIQFITSLLLLFLLPTLSLTPGKYFDRIFIVFFENEGFANVNTNSDFTYLGNLGLLLAHYSGCAHPSQPNYVCLAAGDPLTVTDDTNYNLDGPMIADLLDAKGISWKLYQENYPNGSCFTGDNGDYRRKHNPFISFNSIHNNATRCANIVPGSNFDGDFNSDNLPQFMFYTPNMQNDGHDSSLDVAGKFAKNFFDTYLTKFPNRTLIVVTFDEADPVGSPDYIPNHIVTILLGDLVVPGSVDWNHFSHPSITRLVEENWGLGSLGRRDATSAIMFPQPDVPNMRDSLSGGSLLSVVVLVLVVVFL